MKLASFIVLSASLHGVALVLPISFPAMNGEPLAPVIVVTLEEAGGAPGKGGRVQTKARASTSRTATTKKTFDRKIPRHTKINAPAIATPVADDPVTVSQESSIALPSDFFSLATAEPAPGGAGGGGDDGGGAGYSDIGSGQGSGRGIAKVGDEYIRARPSETPRPTYPDTARRDGEEGHVLLRVLVNEEGQSASVEVNRSSGAEALDQAAIEAIKRWRFFPARVGDRPVESWVRIPIDFRLTDARD